MDFKEKITFVSGFGILTSSCYLFGYWGAFDINVMEFGSIFDLAKLAAFPLIAGLLSLLIGISVAELLKGSRLPAGGGNSTAIGKFGLRHWRILVSLHILAIPAAIILGPEPQRWLIAAVLIGMLSVPLSHVDALVQFMPVPQLSQTILYVALIIPPASFWYGRSDAYLIRQGQPLHVVDILRSKLALTESQDKKVAFLGRVGDFNIFYETLTETVVFAKSTDETPLFVTHPRRIFRWSLSY